MIYMLVSNFGLALMMLVIYIRYSHFKISSAKEIKGLRKKIDEVMAEEQEVENRLLKVTKDDGVKVEELLREIDELRKDKEIDIKIKSELEKQHALSLQKVEDIEKRMEEWKSVQDGVLKDSKDAMLKVGNDLYKKLNENHKLDIETNKNMIGKVVKVVSENLEKIVANSNAHEGSNSKKDSSESSEKVLVKLPELPAVRDLVADPSSEIISELILTMKASGHMVNRDYFVSKNFDETKAKMLLCEMVFLKDNKIYIFDFKACKYLAEYDQIKKEDKIAGEEILKKNLDQYINYLSDSKYRDSILKVMNATSAKFEKVEIVFAISSKEEMKILKETRYFEKARKAELEVSDLDAINNLIL